MLGKGLEPCEECAAGIDMTLIYLGTLAAPFLSLSFAHTETQSVAVHCSNGSKFKGQTLKTMTQAFWICGLDCAARLQKSSHPNGDNA